MIGVAALPQFADFDDDIFYKECEESLLQVASQNFVIEFDGTKATAARDVDTECMEKILRVDRPTNSTTRWINIWGPEQQTSLVKLLAARYDFSPRLLGIMCSKHKTPKVIPSTPRQSGLMYRGHWKQDHTDRRSVETQHTDPEKNSGTPTVVREPVLNLSHYMVVNEVWHFNSVDWGSTYLSVGYNSLSDTGNKKVQRNPNKPTGVRTWTWLVLCNDGTVISVHENPFPSHQGSQTDAEHNRLYAIRRNLYNVFKQLSRANDAYRHDNPINALDIRPGLSLNRQSTIDIKDSASLLFYYLFDDWYTSYALVAKSEHQYGRQLEQLREDMFTKPDIRLIDQLHQYGRELAVLKRMYQSYALIIERLLDRQKPVTLGASKSSTGSKKFLSRTLMRESNTTARLRDESPSLDSEDSEGNSTFGAPLSSAATVRFERLLDRINQLALSEIQECLDEKESLVFLNFNLLTYKESQAVERLTRITILLAKVTILFMPVSLMTAYFSTQLEDLAGVYNVKTYWVSFAVIATLSLLFLVIFGAVSGTLEGKPIYRTLTQTMLDAGRLKWNKRRGKREEMVEEDK